MKRIDTLVQQFVRQLEAEIRAQVSAELRHAMERAIGGGASAGGNGRGHVAASRKPSRGQGGKRTPEEIIALSKRLLAHIQSNPSQRSEQISQATGIPTGDLVLPLKKLLVAKKIKAKGVARGTQYSIA
jgi:hypothetical protein